MEIAGFIRRINRRAKRVDDNVNLATKHAARAMLEEVIWATPVDTGRARSNWRVGVGSPNLGTRAPFAPGFKLGLGESANAGAAINSGSSIINSAPRNVPLFISNNLPYINKLNAGSSKQAPANFIERALARGAARARKVRLLNNGR